MIGAALGMIQLSGNWLTSDYLISCALLVKSPAPWPRARAYTQKKTPHAGRKQGGVMKNDTFDRRAFLKSAVAGTAAAATTLPQATEAQQSTSTKAAPTSEGY